MSTTVTYKGETLTTVNNATKTLETKGTWLEDDIELTDVSGGGSTLGTKSITNNGTYNASSDSLDGYSQVTVSVPASAVDSGTKSITANGNNQDVVGYAAVNVNVPNTYSAGDEGKVVSSGALVAQTAHADVTPSTSDQTIDTTLNNSLKVKGDADLVAGNIKKDVEIFGVTGSYEGGGGSDTFADICNGTATSYESTALLQIPANVLRGITTLTSFKAYNLKDINQYGLGGFRGTVIALPGFTGNVYNGGFAFSGANTLKTVDIGDKVVRFYAGFFNGASNFDTLIIRASTVPSLGNVNAFGNTKFQSGGTGGTLYVPQSLISSYQGASNWSTLLGYANNQIKSIESTHTDPTAPIDLTLYYADGTPISS